MTKPGAGKKVALELIEKYFKGEELKAPKLNVDQARAEYRMYYEARKLQSSFPANASITTNGAPVYPSTTPFHKLSRIGIKDLRIHEPAKGSYLLMRSIELPILVVGIMLFAEDHLGRVIIVTLYNYIDYDCNIPIEEQLPIGTIFIIKEPLLKLATSGQIVVRCDCPTDFVLVNQIHSMYASVNRMKWKNSIDSSPRKKVQPTTALEWKEEGNRLYKERRFQNSIHAYLTALRMPSDTELTVTLQLNTCAAYLALDYFEDSIKYSSLVLDFDSNNVKALFRAGKAHYGLRQFKEALNMFQCLLKIDSTHKEALMEEKRCTDRLKENGGIIDIYKLYLTSLLKPFTFIDFGEYVGPVNVEVVEGKGRGVVATENIKPGTFLLASKAFQAVFDTEQINSVAAYTIHSDYTMDHGNRVKLLAQTCQALMKNPKTYGSSIYRLSTNDPAIDKDYKVFCDESRKEEPIVDAGRIRKILTNNCFSLLPMKDQEQCFTTEKFTGSGFFIYASYFNHSCVCNASWHTFNDVIVIRSTKFIRKGDEITISYSPSREDFLSKEKKDAQRGFLCRCLLCRLDRSEPIAIHKKRAALEHTHEKLCEEHYDDDIIDPSDAIKEEMNNVIRGLETTYSQRSVLKIRLFDPYMRVAQGVALFDECDKNFVTRITDIIDKALGSLGLSCYNLLEFLKKEDYSLPQDALLCEYSIYQAIVFLIFRFHVTGNSVPAEKWTRVLCKIHHLFTGGNVPMLKSCYKESLPFLCDLLTSVDEE